MTGFSHNLPDVMQWEEWGNPKDPEYYEYMKSYAPVDNIRQTQYPNILVTAGVQLACCCSMLSLCMHKGKAVLYSQSCWEMSCA